MSSVVVRILPDGSGRVRIHWFMRDPDGPIETPTVLLAMTALGPITAGGVRGRIACEPRRQDVRPTPSARGPVLCTHSDDVRAVTCPECMAVPEYAAMTARLAEILETAGEGAPAKA